MGELRSLVRVCGERQSPGIKARLFCSPCCDIDVFPPTVKEATPASTDPLAEIQLNAAFTMETGKTFKVFDIVIDSGKFMSEKIGEIGSEAFNNGVDFRIAGTNPLQVAAFEQLVRNCGVWVVETSNNFRYVIGTKDRPAHVESAVLDSGAALSDPNGTTYTIKATNGLPILYYPAALALAIDTV